MKKFFPTFLLIFTLLFISPLLIGAKQTDDPASIMDQGSTRTCLHVNGQPKNISSPGNKEKLKMYATLNLDGKCVSGPSGCEIWLHNSANTNIEANEDMLKYCKNGEKSGNRNYCDRTDEIEEEITHDVEIDAGWTQITNFTILASNDGETRIALGRDTNVLGEETGSTVPNGPVNIEVSDVYAAHVDWSYYAVGDGQALPAEMGTGEGSDPIEEQNASQQLGSFNEPVPTIDINQEGLKEDCLTFYWDPYGRVFDSQSLEPMSGVKVTLLDDQGMPATVDGPFKNYDITKIDNGVYNILVSKEADYQLTINPPLTHLFTREVNLHPNYSNVYSNIYLPGDIFHEAPIPADAPKDFDYSKYQHDIPLTAQGKPYLVPDKDVFVLKSSTLSIDMGGFINFKGRATFPKAKVCLVGRETKKVFGNCVNADKYGNFSINIDKNKSPQEYLYVVAEKIALTEPLIKSNNIDISKINFEDENLTGFEPILNYVEGYTYDELGMPLPNSEVVVKLKDGDIVFYTTTTDATGYFTIYGKDLPFPEYYFEIDDNKGGQPKILTTSEFVMSNKSFLINQSLDLMNSTKNNQPIINPATGELNQIVRINNKPLQSTKIIPNLNFLITGLVVILLLVALVIISVYISKRRVDK